MKTATRWSYSIRWQRTNGHNVYPISIQHNLDIDIITSGIYCFGAREFYWMKTIIYRRSWASLIDSSPSSPLWRTRGFQQIIIRIKSIDSLGSPQRLYGKVKSHVLPFIASSAPNVNHTNNRHLHTFSIPLYYSYWHGTLSFFSRWCCRWNNLCHVSSLPTTND